MKKVLSMLLFVAAASFATSCEELEDLGDLKDDLEDVLDDLLGNETDGMTLYTGDVTVSNMFTPGTIKVYAEQDDDKDEIDIVLIDAQFSEHMPTLDITLDDIKIAADGTFEVTSIEPGIVMEIKGVDVPLDDVSDYEITNVSGKYSADALELEFTCMGCTINFDGVAAE